MAGKFTSFSERNWRNLLMDLESRQVVPIIGADLVVMGDKSTLYRQVGDELISRFSLKQDQLSSDYSLLDVTSLYFQDPGNIAKDLYHEVCEIFKERAWQIPEPLRQLAEITHFDLFVSLTFDSLLEQAVNQVRFQGASNTRVIAYGEKRPMTDIPAEPEIGRPTVYQLFGKLDITGDYGITEEKILEFTHRLQSKDLRPENLFDALQARSLLFLGCGFPGWLARFFLRATKGERLLAEGACGVIVDQTSERDPAFVLFLERRQTNIYTQGNVTEFVAELHRRWIEKFGQVAGADIEKPSAVELPEFKPDSVFLSYASEDRAYALQVKQAFDQIGVDLWYDQRALESGDDYRLKIEKSIENCSYFVPLISRNTATMEKRFFWREWTKAIDQSKEYSPEYPFIQPILLDETPLELTGIPAEFRKRHIRKLNALPELIEDAKKRIRERRLQKRLA